VRTPESEQSVARPLLGSSAFTLIELLVVIAIIAILAGLLLPVFNRITLAGESTKTISNLRQIAAAIDMYAKDNNNFIPAVYTQQSDGGFFGWANLLDYYGYLHDGITTDYNGKRVDQSSLVTMFNPTTRRQYPTAENSGGYGLNGFTTSQTYNAADTTNPMHRTSLAGLKFPARTVLVADGDYHSNAFDWAILDATGEELFPNTFCAGKSHYLFCDGHVEFIAALYPAQTNSQPVGYNTSVFFNPRLIPASY
jgi:prepilin-type N-terminal cleavage/methylation domain-containing protein/prepilin-type processing-associated H-X9-DG protein